MEAIVASILQEYERSAQHPDGPAPVAGCDALSFRPEPPAGALVNLLAREAMAGVMLEIGSGCGYYTLCLADAARDTGGRVIAIEDDPERASVAMDMLRRARLANRVEFRVGNVLDLLEQLEVRVDFALIGGARELYVPCFELLSRRLTSGAMVVADHMIFPDRDLAESERYRRRVRRGGDFESLLLPVGAGLEVARYYGE